MLQRDYIMRLLREFAEALELLLKKDVRKQRDEIAKMYDQYVGPHAFFHAASIDDIMRSMERWPEGERLQRMEMLAELLHVEAGLTTGPARTAMLEKALALFGFIDRHDRTFDMTRLNKMADIRNRLEKDTNN